MTVRRTSDGVIINANELSVDEVVGDRVLCPACHDKVFRYGLRAGMLMLLIDALEFQVVQTRNVRSISSGSGLGCFADLLWHIEFTNQSFAR